MNEELGKDIKDYAQYEELREVAGKLAAFRHEQASAAMVEYYDEVIALDAAVEAIGEHMEDAKYYRTLFWFDFGGQDLGLTLPDISYPYTREGVDEAEQAAAWLELKLLELGLR